MPLKYTYGLTPLWPLVLVPKFTGSNLFFDNLFIRQFAGQVAEIIT